MADIIFVKLQNGQISKLEGELAILRFVSKERQKYDSLEVVTRVYNRISLLEPNPHVRNMIRARLFLTPECVQVFNRVGSMDHRSFAGLIRELKDHLAYVLFPVSTEFDRRAESTYGLPFGGALMRSLAHLPKGPSTYF